MTRYRISWCTVHGSWEIRSSQPERDPVVFIHTSRKIVDERLRQLRLAEKGKKR